MGIKILQCEIEKYVYNSSRTITYDVFDDYVIQHIYVGVLFTVVHCFSVE